MIHLSQPLIFVLWLVVSNFAIADELRRVTDDAGVQLFIESQRTKQNGPGKILASSSGYFDSDSYPDRLVIYTFEHGPNHGDKAYAMYAVAFLTENSETTDVLSIPESEMVSERLLEYSSNGTELVITGEKRLPGDNNCCPSAIASITLSVANGQVVIVKGEYRRQSDPD